METLNNNENNSSAYFLKISPNKEKLAFLSVSLCVEKNNTLLPIYFLKNTTTSKIESYVIAGVKGVFILDDFLSEFLHIIEFDNLNQDFAFTNFFINLNNFEHVIKIANKLNLPLKLDLKTDSEVFYNNKPNFEEVNYTLDNNSNKYSLVMPWKITQTFDVSTNDKSSLFYVKIKNNKMNNDVFYLYYNDKCLVNKINNFYKTLTKESLTFDEFKKNINIFNDRFNLKNFKIEGKTIDQEMVDDLNKYEEIKRKVDISYDFLNKRLILKAAIFIDGVYQYLSDKIVLNKLKNNEIDFKRNREEETHFYETILFLCDTYDQKNKQGFIHSIDKLTKLKSAVKKWKSSPLFELNENYNKNLSDDKKIILYLSDIRNLNSKLVLSFSLDDINDDDTIEIIKCFLTKKQFYETKNHKLINLAFVDFSIINDHFEKLNLNLSGIIGHNIIDIEYTNSNYLLEFLKNNNLNILEEKLVKIISQYEQNTEKIKLSNNLTTILKPYQVEGVQWMQKMINLNMGGILADEMGLGKSIQAIALLDSIYNDKITTLPSIIICPSSLVLNWENEFEKFSQNCKIVLIEGNKIERGKIIAQHKDENIVYITSFPNYIRDVLHYKDISFYVSIIDEVQFIKNSITKFSIEIKKINAKHHFALSGTPFENNLNEVWSIFDYLMPGFLLTKSLFKKNYYDTFLAGNKDPLISKIRPFLLRRTKKDVLDLPDKTIKIITLTQSSKEKELYKKALSDAKKDIERWNSDDTLDEFKKHSKILSKITYLRIISSAPYIKHPEFTTSCKLEYMITLLQNIKENNQKTLVFTQYVKNIKFFKERFDKENIRYQIFEGSLGKVERLAIIKEFNEGDLDVLIISLKAGGLGLTITGANNVILYDPWWNSSLEDQAIDRVHRLGQTKNVTVYKFIARDTIEENVLRLQKEKKIIIEKLFSNDTQTTEVKWDYKTLVKLL